MNWMRACAAGLVLAAIALAAAFAQEGKPDAGSHGEEDAYHHVSGTSKEGDLASALKAAVRAASDLVGQKGADLLVAWEVEKISGRQGGFAGFREVTVTIRFPRQPR